MGEKQQWVEESRGSKIAAVYHGMLTLVEEAAEEEGRSIGEVMLEELVLDPVSLIESRAETLHIRANLSNTYTTEAGNRRIILEPDPELVGVPASEVYNLVPTWVLREDSLILKNLALKTTENGIEFIVLYTSKGFSLVLEGEYLRVRLPFVSVAASVHTHPEGGCGLSLADIVSGLDLLAETGLFEAAVTKTCAAILYRVGPVSEDDYIEARKAILEARKGREVGPLTLKTVRFRLTGY